MNDLDLDMEIDLVNIKFGKEHMVYKLRFTEKMISGVHPNNMPSPALSDLRI